MRYLIGVSFVLMMFVSLVAGCAGPAAETRPSEMAAGILITPMSGNPEARIIIFGAGFVPGEDVKIEVMMAGVSLLLGASEKAHVANESGAIKIASFIPTAMVAKPGVYTVRAIGDKGSFATFPLEVLEVKKK